MSDYKYKRVLLKLSGEAISGEGSIINFDFLEDIAKTLVTLAKDGVEIGVIIGAGNIWRGRSSGDMALTLTAAACASKPSPSAIVTMVSARLIRPSRDNS